MTVDELVTWFTAEYPHTARRWGPERVRTLAQAVAEEPTVTALIGEPPADRQQVGA